MTCDIITGDVHWDANPRNAYRHAFVDWLVGQARKRHARRIIILGDLTVEKNYHDAVLANEVVTHLHNLAQICPIIVNLGNHDYTNPNHPFFQFVKYLPNVTFASTLTCWASPIDSPGYLFLPHTRDYQRDWVNVLDREYDAVFCHQTFQGANVGPRTMDGIPLSVFKNQNLVISGDIHGPQKLPLPNDGYLYYVGAPYRINFGDDYDPRILVLDDAGIVSVAVPGPRKQLVNIHSTNQLLKLDHLAEGDMLKVRIDIDRDSYDQWPKTKQWIEEWADKRGYVLERVQPIFDAPRTLVKPTEHRSDDQLLRTYAKRTNLSDEALNIGLKFLEK